MSLCHDVDLNVDIVMARSRERGEMSTLQALEPRALIPGTQRKPQHTDVKPAGGSGQLAAAPTPQNIHLKYKFLVLSSSFLT